VLIVVNGSAHPVEVTLPTAPGAAAYELLWDSAEPKPAGPTSGHRGVQQVNALSTRLYAATPD
jgi:glycogen operon protein